MSIFTKKDKKTVYSCGIYAMYDPSIPDCKFSPPFFSVCDGVACQALLETLIRKTKSFDDLMRSDFLRMDVFKLGEVILNDGKINCMPKCRYKVCNVGQYVQKDYVTAFLKSAVFGNEQ